MSELIRYGEVVTHIPSHPLLPEGYIFDNNEHPVITVFGEILPSLDFSKQQYEKILKLAEGNITLFDDERVITLATYIAPKLNFNYLTGCWELPLKDEYDSKRRARYPQVSIKSLGYDKQLAHRASMEVFLGFNLPRNEQRYNQVDHRCRSHACCNPYHLEIVTPAENNRRKEVARKRNSNPDLFQVAIEQVRTYGELTILLAID